jgi:phospholipase A1/A2
VCKIGKSALLASFFIHGSSLALASSDAMDQCLLAGLKSADAEVMVGMLTADCEDLIYAADAGPRQDSVETRESVVDLRRDADAEARSNRFVVSTYRPNYFTTTWNSDPNITPYDAPEDSLDEEEVKFQVSFKMPVATELFGGNTDLLFGYTAVSWWQVYNNDADNPFRETNYEPELFFTTSPDTSILGLDLTSWELGLNHQSNGQSGSLSRGWDRAVAAIGAELTDDLVLGLRAWHILAEQRGNSDIERYMGYGELGVGWVPNRNTFTLMYRPASEGDAIQLTWSYPISQYLRVYAQYWNGYGESLIDYDVRTQRFGIGLALSDFISRD